jgi:hypothetical protein
MAHSLTAEEAEGLISSWCTETHGRCEPGGGRNTGIPCPVFTTPSDSIMCDVPRTRELLGLTSCDSCTQCPVREAFREARKVLGIVSEFYQA